MAKEKTPPTITADEARSKMIAIMNALSLCQPTFSGLGKAVQAIERSELPQSDIAHYYGEATATAFQIFQVASRAISQESLRQLPPHEKLALTPAQVETDVKWRRIIMPQLNALMVAVNYAIWDTPPIEFQSRENDPNHP